MKGDSGGTDKPKKAESTSSYNYRVVKEVWNRTVNSRRTSEGFYFLFYFFNPFLFRLDSAATQQVVHTRRSFREEEQETAAETSEEHGGSCCGPGAAADPIREGSVQSLKVTTECQ